MTVGLYPTRDRYPEILVSVVLFAANFHQVEAFRIIPSRGDWNRKLSMQLSIFTRCQDRRIVRSEKRSG